jgi:ribosome recycling factor
MIEVQNLLSNIQQNMVKAIDHLEAELSKIRAGRASTQMLDGIHVDYYGNSTPLNQVANVSTPDARTLSIQPWEKNMLTPIEKAITVANLGFNPQNDGLVIRIVVPALTEERRKELVKRTKTEGEHARVTIRNLRRDANELIKKEVKNHLPEDMAKEAEAKIQQLTDSFIQKIEKHLEVKEKEIMTV